MKVTPWFPMSVSPVREGIYQIDWAPFGDGSPPAWRRWLGAELGWGKFMLRLDDDNDPCSFEPSAIGTDGEFWRGVAK